MPRLSASSLKRFRSCEGQFRFDKLTEHEGMDDENKYTIAGSAIHEAIEETLKDVNEPEELGENELAHLFKSQFHAHPRKDELDQSMINRCMSSLQTAARYLASLPDLSINGIEEEFEVEIDEVPFKGYIDLTTDHSVIDWKSGKIPTGDDIGEKLQGMVYWEGYKQIYGREPEAIRFVYLKESKERVYDEKGEDYDDMIATIRDIKRAVETDTFEYRPGDQCYWCSYELMCPASAVGVGDVRWEVF